MTGRREATPAGRARTFRGDDGTWTVADDGGWIDGIYDSEVTALLAATHAGTSALAALSERVCRVDGEGRAITVADLVALTPSARKPSPETVTPPT